MKRFGLLILTVILLQSCAKTEGSRPEIKKDELVDVLVDIHLTDAYLSQEGCRIDRNRDKIESAYGYVLDKHSVTPKQFQNTMKYYSHHIDAYEQIYNKVIERLTTFESNLLQSHDGNDGDANDHIKKTVPKL